MTDAVLATVVTAGAGIVVAVVTGVLSYRTARWNLRRDLEVDLRRERLKAFKKLWALSEPLAKYGRNDSVTVVTPSTMEQLSRRLRHWYFTDGGMFLSNGSRDAYLAFQEALTDAVAMGRGADEPLDATTHELIRERGSRLRSCLRASFKGFPEM